MPSVVILVGGSTGQIGAIVAGGLAGLVLCREPVSWIEVLGLPKWLGLVYLAAFVVLLLALPVLRGFISWQGVTTADAFYRAGALVFGGGHVTLPLLETEVVRTGLVSADRFLAGYGMAQAVPGPLSAFATYLGVILQPPPNGFTGVAIALVFVFLPGFLLLVGVLLFWDKFWTQPNAQAAICGANAAVVGILGAALYSPVWTNAIIGTYEFALALTCFTLLVALKCPAVSIG